MASSSFPVSNCAACTTEKLCSLKCLHRHRMHILKQHYDLIPACAITGKHGVPCGMPPACGLRDGVIVLLCEGFCGDKHRIASETGEWRHILRNIYIAQKNALLHRMQEIQEKLTDLEAQIEACTFTDD